MFGGMKDARYAIRNRSQETEAKFDTRCSTDHHFRQKQVPNPDFSIERGPEKWRGKNRNELSGKYSANGKKSFGNRKDT